MTLEKDYGRVTDTQPVLVSGVYRSGTTFLAALLGAHREFEASSSTVKFLRFCLGRYGNLDEPGNRQALVSDVAARLRNRWNIELDSDKVIADSEKYPKTYARLYDLIMREHLLLPGNSAHRWVEKMAVGWSQIPDFLNMFPMGKVIHLIRDPRDVVASYKNMTFEIGNTYLDGAFNCRGSMELKSTLPSDLRSRVLCIRIEDFQFRREELLLEIENFLGVNFDENLRKPSFFHAKGEDWAVNTSFGGGYSGWPDGSPRWPERLSRPEILLIELVVQPWLSRWGYVPHVISPNAEDWQAAYRLLNDPFLQSRFTKWLETARGVEGYRSDPYEYEMKLVFPDRYPVEEEE